MSSYYLDYVTERVEFEITKTEEARDDDLPNWLVAVDIKITPFPYLVLMKPHENRHLQKEVALVSLERISSYARIRPMEFVDYRETQEILLGIVGTWPLHPGIHMKNLVKDIDFRLRIIADSMSTDHNLLVVDVEVDIRNEHFLKELTINYDRELILMSSNSLKRKRIEDDDSNESCSICLNEFSKGSQVSFMACSHRFHCNCIGRWLMKSRYCPLCRFEMKTGTINLSERQLRGIRILN